MTSTATAPAAQTEARPYVVPAGEGEHLHFLNHLATVKVDPGDTGSVSVIEFTAPRGFGPPLHQHDDEDEIMLVHEGEISVQSGDNETIATANSTAFLPHGVPHIFQVLSDEARFTVVTTSNARSPRFTEFVNTLGEPTDEAVMPEPGPVDPERVAMVGMDNGITILGPPPAPLD